ncbi:F-box protein VBF-like isoform X2 [Bidens hawaiensis]|uniref:F-box protein VBF-like isoform X2 n=1 Tax=Bidens hawaiensis TaxID=980011 RepID=UPI00404A2CA0
MASAKMFSFKNVKWRSIRKSRFSKVTKIYDFSNLNIQIQLKPQLLTQEIMYGAYLVFKFCNKRKVSSRPLYVNLKYKMARETCNAYFAKWRTGGEWLMVELFQFWNTSETEHCDILLESFSCYYCGNWGIFVEGVEFNAIASVKEYKENNKADDEDNIEGLLKPELCMDSMGKFSIDNRDIIKRSVKYILNAPKEDLYHLLFNGFLIDKGEKIFSLSKVNKKKCHMLRAKAVIYDPSYAKFYNIKPQAQSWCVFDDVIEIFSYHEFRIKCDVETRLLSSDTTYACFLVFKLSQKCRGLKFPVKARDLLPYKKQRTNIISFTTPNTMNLNNIKWIPKEREDGWMEVIVWETISSKHNEESIPMDLNLISFEGTMAGLIIYGIEFRPI